MSRSRKTLHVGDQVNFRMTGDGAQVVVDFLNTQENRSQAVMDALYFYATNCASRPYWLGDFKEEILAGIQNMIGNGTLVTQINSDPMEPSHENIETRKHDSERSLEEEIGGSMMNWED